MDKAIICDIDGTLADLGQRSPFDFANVDRDTVKHATAELVRVMHGAGYKIVLMTGREDSSRTRTLAWLTANEIPHDLLLMRKRGDHRRDTIVKRELYRASVKQNHDVLFVLEDRDQVVEMWRKQEGLVCYQVEYGDF